MGVNKAQDTTLHEPDHSQIFTCIMKSGGGEEILPWHAVRAQTSYYLKGCTKVKSLIPLIQTTNKQNPKNGILEHSWALPGVLRGLSIHIVAASYEPPAKKLLQGK